MAGAGSHSSLSPALSYTWHSIDAKSVFVGCMNEWMNEQFILGVYPEMGCWVTAYMNTQFYKIAQTPFQKSLYQFILPSPTCVQAVGPHPLQHLAGSDSTYRRLGIYMWSLPRLPTLVATWAVAASDAHFPSDMYELTTSTHVITFSGSPLSLTWPLSVPSAYLLIIPQSFTAKVLAVKTFTILLYAVYTHVLDICWSFYTYYHISSLQLFHPHFIGKETEAWEFKFALKGTQLAIGRAGF